MHNDIPRSAIESLIHAENQAATKEPERGIRESLRELWGTVAESAPGNVIGFAYEQLGNIFDAGVSLFGEAAVSVRHELDVVAYGRDTLPRQNQTIHSGTIDVADHQPSFDELMDQRASMLPPAENTPEQPPPTIDR